MRSWFYVKDEQQHGPISEAELIEMFTSGILSTDTLVWTEDLTNWMAAREVRNLLPEDLLSPPVATQLYYQDGNWAPSTYTNEYQHSGPQVRPWLRFWARCVDIILFSIIIGFVLGFLYPPALKIGDTLFGMMLAFTYVFVEPIMLSSWGTTPGKALLRIRLRRYDGSKLTFSEGLNRAFNVWFKGEGACFPVVALFTQINAYRRLLREGKTTWDRDGRFLYSHQIVGPLRTVLTALLLSGFIVIMALGQMEP